MPIQQFRARNSSSLKIERLRSIDLAYGCSIGGGFLLKDPSYGLHVDDRSGSKQSFPDDESVSPDDTGDHYYEN